MCLPMSAAGRFRFVRKLVVMVAALILGGTGLLALPGAAQAAGSLPCDIYGASGTSCVAAYSTVRALYSSYNGPLYQVRRVSDGGTADVGLLAAGGYANATEQDAFCAHTTCVITKLYDQSPEHNDLTIEGPGGAAGQDVGANAAALPVVAGGHKVYGLYIAGQTGYRDNSTRRDRDGRPGRGHVHGGQRHPRQRRLLLRLRQRRDEHQRQRQRAHGRRQPGHGVLLLPVYRKRPLGRGRYGKRPVLRRERPQHRQRREQQQLRHRTAEEQRPDDLRAQGRQRAIRRPDDVVERRPAQYRRLHADAPGRRDRAGHRRGQQQLVRRLLLRGRDDRGLPGGRRRQRRPGEYHLGRLLRRVGRRHAARGHDYRPGRAVRGHHRRRHRDGRRGGRPVELPVERHRPALDAQLRRLAQHPRPLPRHRRRTAPRSARRSSYGTATASAARSGSSSPTARCSTPSRGCAWTTRAATPRTAPSCRSGPATAPRLRCSRSTAAA